MLAAIYSCFNLFRPYQHGIAGKPAQVPKMNIRCSQKIMLVGCAVKINVCLILPGKQNEQNKKLPLFISKIREKKLCLKHSQIIFFKIIKQISL